MPAASLEGPLGLQHGQPGSLQEGSQNGLLSSQHTLGVAEQHAGTPEASVKVQRSLTWSEGHRLDFAQTGTPVCTHTQMSRVAGRPNARLSRFIMHISCQ